MIPRKATKEAIMATFVVTSRLLRFFAKKHFFPSPLFSNNLFRAICTPLKLDPEVEENLEKKYTFKKHPGVMHIKSVSLPEPLQEAIANVISNQSLKDLQGNAQTLVQHLERRKPPVENEEIRIYSREMSKELEKERGVLKKFSPEDIDSELEERKEIIHNYLRSKLYHWKPIDYNFYIGILYTVAKMAPNYAVLNQIFSEIKQRDSQFQPKTLLDFGSGVGTTLWAAHNFWGKTLKEYLSIDTSADMNKLSDILIRGGNETNDPLIKNIFYKEYLSTVDLLKYNVVVSAHSLLELPSVELRLQTLNLLWRKTEDYLVIVENGSNAGYKIILEAREFITHLQKTKQTTDFHIFAPCPHEKECPRSVDGTNTPCNFEVNYLPFNLPNKDVKKVPERFSYVVFKRGSKSSEYNWPRVVRPVLIRKKHVVCRLCTKQGCLTDTTITAAKHGKPVYKCARYTKWGDFLPVEVEENSRDSSIEEVESSEINN